MDTAQWPQGIGVVKTTSMDGTRHVVTVDQRKARPQKDQALNCPRCNSTNTKFCYYNNYSLTQPRYFCKTCRRYWTEGGSLRNVPVGGGSRKNKRFPTSSSSTTTTSSSPIIIPTTSLISNSASQNPKIHHAQDLNLAYPSSTDHHHHHHHQDYNSTNLSKFIELVPPNNPSSTTSNSSHFSSMELLKSDHNTIITSRGLISTSSPFMPVSVSDNSNTIYSSSSGFPMQEYKPTLNFSLDGFENGYDGSSSLQGVQQHNGGSGSGGSNSARLLFPFEELKQQVSTTTSEFDHHRSAGNNGDSTGYWNGMLSGGSW